MRARLIAVLFLVVGALITLYALGDSGASFSFTLLLGLLCLADGVLRFAQMRYHDR